MTRGGPEMDKITPAVLFGIAFTAFFALGYMLGSSGSLNVDLEGEEVTIIHDQLQPSEIGDRAVNYMQDRAGSSTTVNLINVSDSDLDGFYRVWLKLKEEKDGQTSQHKTKIYASKKGTHLIGKPINSSEEIRNLLPIRNYSKYFWLR